MIQRSEILKLKAAFEDLQNADYKSWLRRISRVQRVFDGAEFKNVVSALEPKADLNTWLETVSNSRGGMVGTAKLNWPTDPEESAALTIKLVRYFSEDAENVMSLAHELFGNTRYDDDISDVVRNILIPSYADFIEYIQNEDLLGDEQPPRYEAPITKRVFLVHGRDNSSKNEVARFLEKLGLDVTILHERPNKGRTLIAKFQEESSDVSFAVVLVTPDDHGGLLDGEQKPRARQNVIFELGFFIGKLGSERVCALVSEGVERPSDYDGVAYVQLDQSGGWKGELARELSAARIPIDLAKAFGGQV